MSRELPLLCNLGLVAKRGPLRGVLDRETSRVIRVASAWLLVYLVVAGIVKDRVELLTTCDSCHYFALVRTWADLSRLFIGS